jgi:hypothetical protein
MGEPPEKKKTILQELQGKKTEEFAIFGGFTRGQWMSHVRNGKHRDENNCRKSDESSKNVIYKRNLERRNLSVED